MRGPIPSTCGASNCSFVTELLFIHFERPPRRPAKCWLRATPTLTPDCAGGGGWAVGGGALCERLWKALAPALRAAHVDCSGANCCGLCKDSFLREAVLGGNMSCLNMMPISTVNLVNSVEGKKKAVSPT